MGQCRPAGGACNLAIGRTRNLLLTLSRVLFNGCWLCVDAELAIGQCRLGVGARNLWSEQPLAPDLQKMSYLGWNSW